MDKNIFLLYALFFVIMSLIIYLITKIKTLENQSNNNTSSNDNSSNDTISHSTNQYLTQTQIETLINNAIDNIPTTNTIERIVDNGTTTVRNVSPSEMGYEIDPTLNKLIFNKDIHLNVDHNMNLFPNGTIIMYYNQLIPAGWVLCDGTAYGKRIDNQQWEAIDTEKGDFAGWHNMPYGQICDSAGTCTYPRSTLADLVNYINFDRPNVLFNFGGWGCSLDGEYCSGDISRQFPSTWTRDRPDDAQHVRNYRLIYSEAIRTPDLRGRSPVGPNHEDGGGSNNNIKHYTSAHHNNTKQIGPRHIRSQDGALLPKELEKDGVGSLWGNKDGLAAHSHGNTFTLSDGGAHHGHLRLGTGSEGRNASETVTSARHTDTSHGRKEFNLAMNHEFEPNGNYYNDHAYRNVTLGLGNHSHDINGEVQGIGFHIDGNYHPVTTVYFIMRINGYRQT